ncbi:hypothetical protein [Brevibacillus agri]|uniref:hypothetical protein n=1 Tax=Brevibacillus agri TaxID=51101 RepID=UPI002867B4E7|nr:hypothetical protein [Brevibacillus agri]
MQAGRELDAKVAEALGWQWAETHLGLEGLFPPEGDIRYNTALYGPLRFDKDGYLETMPRYSTSWAGMGELIEEARKQRLEIALVSNASGHWARVFPEGNYPDDPFLADHSDPDSMPYAACMALLKAKGVIANA